MQHLKPVHRGISTREIVIVAVLVLILGFVGIPYYFQQQSNAVRVASANNLQQWGIALNLYLIENGNRLPQAGQPFDGQENKAAWYNALPLYISQRPYSEMDPSSRPRPGQRSVWMDPSVEESEAPALGEPFFTYAMNRWLQPKKGEASYKIFDLANPSTVVFLTETLGADPAITSPEARFRYEDPATDEPAAHVLFCDGHVELVGKSQLQDAPGSNDAEQAMGKVNWIPFYQAPRPE